MRQKLTSRIGIVVSKAYERVARDQATMSSFEVFSLIPVSW